MARSSIVAALLADATLTGTGPGQLGVTQVLPGTAGPIAAALPLVVYEVLPGNADQVYGPDVAGTTSTFRFHCYAETVAGSHTATMRADAIAERIRALLQGFANVADGVRIALLDGPPFDGPVPAGEDSLAHRIVDFTVLAT